MRRGSAYIILVTFAEVPSIGVIVSFRAVMPMIVSMQLASDVAVRSVGEKASPFPLLSFGASVMMIVFDPR